MLDTMHDHREPMPSLNKSLAVTDVARDLFNKTLTKQSDAGLEKYGTRLQYCNGRSALNDSFQELADLSQYLTQLGMEHKLMLAFILYLVDEKYIPIEFLGNSLYALVHTQSTLTDEEYEFYKNLILEEMKENA